MTKFVVAFIYEDFPRYDKVERTASEICYFDGDKVVAKMPLLPLQQIILKDKKLGLEFVVADTGREACQKTCRSFPLNIIATVVAEVPP